MIAASFNFGGPDITVIAGIAVIIIALIAWRLMR